MKKTFFEPEMQKIELNLRENIATSSETGDMFVQVLQASYFSCTVQRTGKLIFNCSESDLRSCTVYGSAGAATWSIGRKFPVRELLPYIKQ